MEHRILEDLSFPQEISFISEEIKKDKLSAREIYSLYISVKLLLLEYPEKSIQLKRFKNKLALLLKSKINKQESLSEQYMSLVR